MHVCVTVGSFMYSCMFVLLCVFVCICVNVCVQMYTHAHAHTHTHTHAHTTHTGEGGERGHGTGSDTAFFILDKIRTQTQVKVMREVTAQESDMKLKAKETY
jgi:hypothetical protein